MFVFAGCGAISLSGHPSFSALVFRAILNSPFVGGAFFLLAVAEVRAAPEFLEYRRLIDWTRVPYDQITQCGKSWFPYIGYMKLIRSGQNSTKIYFVTGTLVSNDSPRTELTEYIINRCSRKADRTSKPKHSVDARGHSKQFCFIMALVGVLYSILLALFFPILLNPDLHSLPPAVEFPTMLLWRASTWPWALITCMILIVQVVRMNYKKKAWSSALVFGVVLGYMIAHALRS
jgi:hypothetical protein